MGLAVRWDLQVEYAIDNVASPRQDGAETGVEGESKRPDPIYHSGESGINS